MMSILGTKIKKRRKKQLDFLQRGFTKDASEVQVLTQNAASKMQLKDTSAAKPKRHGLRLRTQFITSCVLLAMALIGLATPLIQPGIKQRFISLAGSELDLSRFADWYADYFGEETTILPAFKNYSVGFSSDTLVAPIKGKIVQPYDEKKVVIDTGLAGAAIVSVSSGEVIFAGSKEGEGNLVTIRHSNGNVSHYGLLGELYVTSGDTVNQGQNIAATTEMNGHFLTSFSMQLAESIEEFIDWRTLGISFE